MNTQLSNVAQRAGLDNRRILVVGLGKTGLSVLAFFRRHKIDCELVDALISDEKVEALADELNDVVLHRELNDQLVSSFDVLIVSPGVPLAQPSIQQALAAGKDVLSDIELFARLVEVPVLAVTGSNGKSTVVAWIEKVLQTSNVSALACGNIGEPVLEVLEQSAELYVLELSSYQLETLRSLKPLAATVLNVSEDHLDRYDDIEHYAQTKQRVYQNAGLIVCNVADVRTQPTSFSATNNAGRSANDSSADASHGVVFFGDKAMLDKAGLDDLSVSYGLQRNSGDYWLYRGSTPLMRSSELLLRGKHNAENALAILALLSPLQLPDEIVLQGLKVFEGLPHRTQLVATINGVRWYNDSKGTNVDACIKAIESMEAPVILIAGGLGKDADFSLLRPVVDATVKHLILIGRDAGLIEAALHDLVNVHHAGDMRDAVSTAQRLAVAGDAVLLSPACASFDMFASYEQRGDHFAREVRRLAA